MGKTVIRIIALLAVLLLLAVFASSSVPLAIAEGGAPCPAPSVVAGATAMLEG